MDTSTRSLAAARPSPAAPPRTASSRLSKSSAPAIRPELAPSARRMDNSCWRPLKSGKHVYCEKPLGVTPAQVKALMDAARTSNRVFVAGQQLRSQRLLAEAVRKVHEDVIG